MVPAKVVVTRMKRERRIKEPASGGNVWHLETKYVGVRQTSWMKLGLFFDTGS